VPSDSLTLLAAGCSFQFPAKSILGVRLQNFITIALESPSAHACPTVFRVYLAIQKTCVLFDLWFGMQQQLQPAAPADSQQLTLHTRMARLTQLTSWGGTTSHVHGRAMHSWSMYDDILLMRSLWACMQTGRSYENDDTCFCLYNTKSSWYIMPLVVRPSHTCEGRCASMGAIFGTHLVKSCCVPFLSFFNGA
jgi:hypothetical protein